MNFLASVRDVLRHYKWDFAICGILSCTIFYAMGWLSLTEYLVLSVLEVSLSFDNAVVNAQILKMLSPFWQNMFMWIGLPIAVGGMRFLFPVVIVWGTAHLGFSETISMAFNRPEEYSVHLHHAHGQIAMLGGVFLGLIFLGFLFDKDEENIMWFHWLERRTSKLAPYNSIEVGPVEIGNLIGTGIISVVVGVVAFTAPHNTPLSLIVPAVISLVAYHIVNIASNFLETKVEELAEAELEKKKDELSQAEVDKKIAELEKQFAPELRKAEKSGDTAKVEELNQLIFAQATKVFLTGGLAFLGILALEGQDASFSFDGVSGAFAITSNLKLIMAGLATGALFVRSITLRLVRTDALAKYRYLAHGANYAIGVLALCIFISEYVNVPEWVTGPVGAILVGLATWHSRKANLRDEAAKKQKEQDEAAARAQESVTYASPETIRALGTTALRGAGVSVPLPEED